MEKDKNRPLVGTRSGKLLLEGKIIRKHVDGVDVFEDYFTDSSLQYPSEKKSLHHMATCEYGVDNSSACQIVRNKKNIDNCHSLHQTCGSSMRQETHSSSIVIPKCIGIDVNSSTEGFMSSKASSNETAVKQDVKDLQKNTGFNASFKSHHSSGQNSISRKKGSFRFEKKKGTPKSLPSSDSSKKKSCVHVTKNACGASLRRSQRICHPPLQYWRNERVLYKFTESGDIVNLGLDPGTTDQIVRVVPKTIRQTKKKKNPKKIILPKKKIAPQESPTVLQNGIPIYDPEISEVVNAKVAIPYKSLHWISPEPSIYYKGITVTKAINCTDSTYGFMRIQGMKLKQPVKICNHSIIFVVLKGKVEFTIHRTKKISEKLDMFIVPGGNTYSIQNLLSTEALLSFSSTFSSLIHELVV